MPLDTVVQFDHCLHLQQQWAAGCFDYVGMATWSYYESFTLLHIINGFRSRGLWPINAAEALEAMKNVEPSERKKRVKGKSGP